MSKNLEIEINEEEFYEELDENKSFLDLLKDALLVFEGVPLDKVVNAIQSEEWKIQREEIEKEFWTVFSEISKDDDSLDCAILMQQYGFTLSKTRKNKEKFFQS